jgi:hypothetical protein
MPSTPPVIDPRGSISKWAEWWKGSGGPPAAAAKVAAGEAPPTEKEDERTLAVSQHTHDAGPADTLRHVDARLAQLASEPLRRHLLEEGELGIAMKVLEQGSEMLVVVAQGRLAPGLGIRCGGGK